MSEQQLPLDLKPKKTGLDRECPLCGKEMRLESRGHDRKVLYCPGANGWDGCIYGEGEDGPAARQDVDRVALIKGAF